MKKGLTLIELALVIVIISGLFALISVFSGFKNQFKISKTISELERIDSVYDMFYIRYRYPPGDFSDAYSFFSGYNCGDYDTSGGSEDECNGNGDYSILNDDDNSDNAYREEHNFWNHLLHADLMTDITADGHAYYSAKGYDALVRIGAQSSSNEDILYFGMASAAAAAYQTYDNKGGFLTPTIMDLIDNKFDDGVANGGRFQGSEDTGATCYTTTSYDVSDSDKECAIIYYLKQDGDE